MQMLRKLLITQLLIQKYNKRVKNLLLEMQLMEQQILEKLL
ncbi:397L [Invertebrate iridescent virus Kaz2018]|uniref:397L n=1 Tax=Invertebrate iridescent virus 6 TaxID=176652 RepID=Q91FC8_IIV6|nr:397L [Invertebrate iridescent virus 6]AAK82257.1 397L [Invertebrate iridescent virus 6]QMS79421.1 hypothetical protein IIV6-T1_390 [Invertebrate iridescent virus 6]QNH08807.1 397L [Invertebrate iridescent virus Kaz2018]